MKRDLITGAAVVVGSAAIGVASGLVAEAVIGSHVVGVMVSVLVTFFTFLVAVFITYKS